MKQKIFPFLLILFCSSSYGQESDPIALTINGNAVYKSEIQRRYNLDIANQSAKGDADWDTFINSFIDFKLSVEEAKDLQLDLTPGYKRSYSSFSIELSQSYDKEMNKTVEDKTINMIYKRVTEDVELNHTLIPFGTDELLPKDTLELYNKAIEYRKQLIKNKFKGEGLSDNTKATHMIIDKINQSGYLGWMTPFVMPTEVEDAMYSMTLNEISMPIRSNSGYHIIQVLNRRPAKGLIGLEQIFFGFTQIPPSKQQIDSVNKIVQKLHKSLVKNPSEFDAICKEYAEGKDDCDFGAHSLNSELPANFIAAAYQLENIGDVSAPVQTDYGFHVIRLKDRFPVGELQAIRENLWNGIKTGDRYNYYGESILIENQHKYKAILNESSYKKIEEIATTRSPLKVEFTNRIINNNDVLLTIGDTCTYRVSDFAKYLQSKTEILEKDLEEKAFVKLPVSSNLSTDQLKDLFEAYLGKSIVEYADATREVRIPEFAHFMKDYSEGVLFFDVKDAHVWSKAKTDIKALESLYNKNKAKYGNKNFSEAKNLVELDYQEILEKEWSDKLRKKYKVSLNESVINTIR